MKREETVGEAAAAQQLQRRLRRRCEIGVRDERPLFLRMRLAMRQPARVEGGSSSPLHLDEAASSVHRGGKGEGGGA